MTPEENGSKEIDEVTDDVKKTLEEPSEDTADYKKPVQNDASGIVNCVLLPETEIAGIIAALDDIHGAANARAVDFIYRTLTEKSVSVPMTVANQ